MASNPALGADQKTLSLADFWQWLQHHTNCVLRAGSPGAALFDHEDLHWTFSEVEPQMWLVQLIRGKVAIGELVIMASDVSHVTVTAGEEDDHVFELVTCGETGTIPVAHFVMSHAYDGASTPGEDPWIN